MEKQTVFIKRYPSKGELPDKSKWNVDWFIVGFSENQNYYFQGFVHNGVFIQDYKQGYESINKPFDPQPLWWLEEIELPLPADILIEVVKRGYISENLQLDAFINGANFIHTDTN